MARGVTPLFILGVFLFIFPVAARTTDLSDATASPTLFQGNLDIVTGLINFNANLEARNKVPAYLALLSLLSILE